MASNITLSAGVRQNLLALQSTATLLSTTQNRLATGKKVNTALDNPTSFFTSSALSARASDLSQILDSMSNGISTLQAANNGLTSITNTVNSMQATINQARQDASWKSASYTIDSSAIGTTSLKQLTLSDGTIGTTGVTVDLNIASTGGTASELDTSAAYTAPATAGAATYTAQSAFAATTQSEALTITFGTSSVGVSLTTSEATLNEQVDKINAAILLDSDSNGVIKAQASGGKLQITTTGNVDGSISVSGAGATNVFGGTPVSVAGSDGLTSFTVNGDAVTLNTSDANVTAAVNHANLQLTAANSKFEAYVNSSTKLGIREKSAQGVQLTIGGADAGLFTTNTNTGTAGVNGSVKTVDQLVDAINTDSNLTGKVKASNDNGKLNIQNLSTDALTVTGATSTTINGTGSTTSVGGNTVRKNLITQFNQLRSQLDKLADDASFNGINLLHGDTLKLTFNETNTSSISIVSQDTNGINSSVLGIGTADATEFSDNSALDTRSDALSNALTSLRSQSSAFGSNLSIVQNRQDFTKNMINTLQTGSDNLVLADTNEEAANLLALQTRQQLSTTALSLANQSAQAVLRLF
jgi:flagellin-like hook-associated protein FlgL